MNVVGIDPGLQGGIAILDSSTIKVVSTYKMPTKKVGGKLVIDCKMLLKVLEEVCKGATVIIEDVFIGKGMSCKSSKTTISNWGMILGLLRLINVEPVIVGASTWQSYMFKGVNVVQQQGDKVIKLSKIKSLHLAAELGYCGPSDGVADAVVIAYYYISSSLDHP